MNKKEHMNSISHKEEVLRCKECGSELTSEICHICNTYNENVVNESFNEMEEINNYEQ
jgi:recombinational DNA repair protein RecR